MSELATKYNPLRLKTNGMHTGWNMACFIPSLTIANLSA